MAKEYVLEDWRGCEKTDGPIPLQFISEKELFEILQSASMGPILPQVAVWKAAEQVIDWT